MNLLLAVICGSYQISSLVVNMLAKLLEKFCYSLGKNRVSSIFREIPQCQIVIYDCLGLMFIILNSKINFREIKY